MLIRKTIEIGARARGEPDRTHESITNGRIEQAKQYASKHHDDVHFFFTLNLFRWLRIYL